MKTLNLYPITFGTGGSISFTATVPEGSSADVYFRFEYMTYPDVDPSYSTEVVTITGPTADYTIDIPTQGNNTFSSFLFYVSTLDTPVTMTGVSLSTSEVSGPVEVVGCMDSDATNYNMDAGTIQGYDQYVNLQCAYASCDDIPDAEGCIYAETYAPFNEFFGPVEC